MIWSTTSDNNFYLPIGKYYDLDRRVDMTVNSIVFGKLRRSEAGMEFYAEFDTDFGPDSLRLKIDLEQTLKNVTL